MRQESRFQRSFGPGLQAVRDHWPPFLAIQVCIVLAVVAYYQIPAFAEFAGTLARIKTAGGLPFSFITTIIAGAVLPEMFKAATRDGRRLGWPEFLYMCLVFGGNGVIVDLFYQFQGHLFGNDSSLKTVAIKVFFDQAFASWLMFMPYFMLMVLWRRVGFRFHALRQELKERPLYRQMWPMLVVGWAFWIPALCGIYAMPGKLQFVLFLFVEAAWALIIVHVAKSTDTGSQA